MALVHYHVRLSAVLILGVAALCCNADGGCDGGTWATIDANKANTTALKTIYAPAWVSAPEFRGTMSIIQSCVLTLVACIYTALHLNVPFRTDFTSILVLKIKWVAIALFAPEIVLYMAASQFFQARRLKVALQSLQSKSENVDKNASKP